jgi:hypothetical protein
MNKWMTMALFAALSAVGCQTSPVASDYGRSVRQLNTNQVYNPATIATPSAAAVEGADPEMLALAVKTLRTEATDRSKVAQPLVINVGSSGGQ